MAGKPSKYSSPVELNSQELDEWMGPEDSMMSFDRHETRKHFEANEVMSKEDQEYQEVIDNRNRLRDFAEDPNPRGRTFRKVRGD